MARTKIPEPAVVDFETMPIAEWPDYPPKPTGVSIILPGESKSTYWSWGHPTDNNCSFADGKRKLAQAWNSPDGVLCHHGKFDQAVAYEHCGMPPLPWDKVHESMFLVFLSDPHSPDLALKPAAERLLGMPPEESDELREWLVKNGHLKKGAKEFGHLIWKAPGKLVGRYADGDTIRAKKLFKKLYPEIIARGMQEAYDRERRLTPVLLRNEGQGVPVDLKLMRVDAAKYGKASETVDGWLRKTLKVGVDFNLDSDDQLADALVLRKKAQPDLFLVTPGGKRSVAKDSLIGAVTDKKVLSALQYRSRLQTALGTFLLPWLREAEGCGGIVHPSWNQVRQYGAGGLAGARTGRLSASRFMNVPKKFKERTTGRNAYAFPSHIEGLAELPFMRQYMKPFPGEVWGRRDYKQQELRVMAHFGDGAGGLPGELMARYHEDPTLDVHDLAAAMISDQYGMPVTRDDTKTIGFGLIYGMGLGALADALGTDTRGAGKVKDAYLGIFPELKELQKDLKKLAAEGAPMRTWGGREYFCEEPKFSERYGRTQTFEYKMINYLVQGSSADCTKEAIIRYDQAREHGRFLLTVHDEIDISVRKEKLKKELLILRDVMASVEFDVLMLSDAEAGPNWGALQKVDEPEYKPKKVQA